MLICIGGRPGSGKSTLINLLLKNKLVDRVVTKDEVFEQLFPNRDPHDYKYRLLVIEKCLDLSRAYLQADPEAKVAVEMTFSKNDDIHRFFALATRMNSRILFVYLKCPDNICMNRIKHHPNPSFPSPLRINRRSENLPLNIPIHIIDATKNPEQCFDEVKKLF